MAPEDLLHRLQERPFRPFRLHLSNGSSYEVRHPEMVMPGRRQTIIGLAYPGLTLPMIEDYVVADTLHITHLEPLDVATKAS